MIDYKEAAVKLAQLIEHSGLTYSADFVPFSKSRNAKPVKSATDLTLNWRVTFTKGHRALATDYQQGIAHMPGYKQAFSGRMSVDEFEEIKRTCETGKAGHKPIPAPTAADVMSCLLLDSSAIDCPTYEEWAGDYGYDVDSRAGEKIYRECQRIGLELRALIGDSTMQAMREVAQEM